MRVFVNIICVLIARRIAQIREHTMPNEVDKGWEDEKLEHQKVQLQREVKPKKTAVEELADLLESLRKIRKQGWHWHTCTCGHSWKHGNNCAGDESKHICSECGALITMKDFDHADE